MKRFGRIVVWCILSVIWTGILIEPVRAELVLPEAYMNDIDEVRALFPATRRQAYNDCWAYSAVGLAEFDMIIDNQTADKTVDYSELQLEYFTYYHAVDPLGGTFGDHMELWDGYHCQTAGGNLAFAARTLLRWVGLTLETELPYAAVVSPLEESLAYENNAVHLQNVYCIDIHREPELVKQQIMAHGAAGIGYYVSESRLENFWYEGNGSYQGQIVPTYYCNRPGKTANHAVNIIGWDDHFPAENFVFRPPGDGAWLVRNSWSEENTYNADTSSYFWLSYYDKSLEDEAWIFDFEDAGCYDYNYQYDGGNVCGNLYAEEDCEAVANVFWVRGESYETLNAVSVSLLNDENVPYTIRIYTDLADQSKPCSGYLAATVSGQTGPAGVYTISLPKPVPLAGGTGFSVVVELGREGAGVDIECGVRSQQLFFTSEVLREEGQSFALVQGDWKDLVNLDFASDMIHYKGLEAYTGNWCVKAYTRGVESDAMARVNQPVKKTTAKKSISLSWNGVQGADGYEIFRASDKNGIYEKIATVKSADKTKYRDSGLKKNTSYYYRVRAYKNAVILTEDGLEETVRVVGGMSDVKKLKTKKK